MGETVLLHPTPRAPFCTLPLEPPDAIAMLWYSPALDAVCVVTGAGRRFLVDRIGTAREITKPAAMQEPGK